MTRIEALKELAEKVEAGECENDGTMGKAFGGNWTKCFSAYHGSLDAAKALHDSVLPKNWIVHGIDQDSAHRWYVTLSDVTGKSNTIPHTGHPTNPARAWLLSIIRALIAEEEGK